jgi:alkyl hydroperoxide reductase subunit AhpC
MSNQMLHTKASGGRSLEREWRFSFMAMLASAALTLTTGDIWGQELKVKQALDRVRTHTFHPLDEDRSFTVDRMSGKHGVADLRDPDGRVRLLAIRDLVVAGTDAAPQMIEGLRDSNEHVRQVSAAALGILSAVDAVKALEHLLQEDPSSLVRTQAAVSLGQVVSRDSTALLRLRMRDDPSRDVRLQCERAIDRIEKGMGATDELRVAYRQLNPQQFASVRVGEPAPDFTLPDTEGRAWKLSDFQGKSWVVLIWVFAEWCPVCHGEFRELIELRKEFEQAGVQVMTVECHDLYRCRVMVGKELEPAYWFVKQSFKDVYTQGVWWPHLVDRAGAVGAIYGMEPLAFAVHSEYINRPSTVIVDPAGEVRFAYYGTFWGDRPTIHQTLQMIKEARFEFEHPQRLKHTAENAAGSSE